MILRESATAVAVVEALRVAVIEAPNAYNYSHGTETMRDSYLRKIDELQGQLGNVFDRASVEDELLHTPRYWFIANNPAAQDQPAMFRTVNNAVSKEIDALVARVEAAHKAFKWLALWLDISPGVFALLDTNVLMHCEPVDTIDWHAALKDIGAIRVQPPRLVIPLAVVDELDRKKFEGGDNQRGRAQKAIKSIRHLRDGYSVDQPAIVKAAGGSAVTLEIPRDDIGRTRKPITDDEVIAFGQFLAQTSRRTVSIVTRDLGMQLRAERVGLKVVWLDDRHAKDRG